jgi:hypothetical protein
MKSLRVAWYKKPILQDAFFTDIQTGSMITAIFSMVGNDFLRLSEISLLLMDISFVC